MNKIKTKDALGREIMDQSRHLFVYGFDTEERKEFLKTTADAYPVSIGAKTPAGIYISEPGLKEAESLGSLSKDIITIYHRDYLNTLIAKYLIKKVITDVELLQINQELLSEFIDRFNKLYLNKVRASVTDLKNIDNLLAEGLEVYSNEWKNYIASGKTGDIHSAIPVSMHLLEHFVKHLKLMFQMNSYFGVIIDADAKLSTPSKMAVNSLVNARINSDLSIKVACTPEDWEVYKTPDSGYIQASHDYGEVELDDSARLHLSKLKEKYLKI